MDNIYGLKELGKLIKEEREKLKLSVREVQNQTSVNRATISKIEKGESNLTLESINTILQFFNIKIQISLKL